MKFPYLLLYLSFLFFFLSLSPSLSFLSGNSLYWINITHFNLCLFGMKFISCLFLWHIGKYIRYTFSSNYNKNKILWGLCFGNGGPLINRFLVKAPNLLWIVLNVVIWRKIIPKVHTTYIELYNHSYNLKVLTIAIKTDCKDSLTKLGFWQTLRLFGNVTKNSSS